MSGISGNDEQPVPPAKKQRREIDLGGPMYDEATARKNLEEAGFDPDDLNKKAEQSGWGGILPMPTFCFKGDLYMCRYLLSKGVATTKSCDVKDIYYPMMLAAMGGKLHVCKWLYGHGAHTDIGEIVRKPRGDMLSPLFYACRSSDEHHMNVGKWLILKGALLSADSSAARSSGGGMNGGGGAIDRKLMRSALRPLRDSIDYIFDESPAAKDIRPAYLSWARDISSAHDSFFVFLCGATLAITPPSFSKQALLQKLAAKLDNSKVAFSIVESMADKNQLQVWKDFFDLPIRGLSGKVGLLRLIADFAGVVRGREVRIIRGLEHELRLFIVAEPFDDDESSAGVYMDDSSLDSSDNSDSESE